ncbi:hypothetical protein F9Z84_06140 [Escherichia coli]|nr:hypothetical protein F9Z84_06140 [Escherichia coli]
MPADQPFLSTNMSIHEIYRVRNWASKTKNRMLVTDIFILLNAKYGAFGDAGAKSNPDGTQEVAFEIATLGDVLSNHPPEVVVVVDHAITNTGEAERNSHVLQEVVHERFKGEVKISMHSGEIDGDNLYTYHVVLLALPTCFVVLKARGTSTSGQVVPYESLR